MINMVKNTIKTMNLERGLEKSFYFPMDKNKQSNKDIDHFIV